VLVQIDSRTPPPLYKKHSERRHLISARKRNRAEFRRNQRKWGNARSPLSLRHETLTTQLRVSAAVASSWARWSATDSAGSEGTKNQVGCWQWPPISGNLYFVSKIRIKRTRSGYRYKNLEKKKPLFLLKSKRKGEGIRGWTCSRTERGPETSVAGAVLGWLGWLTLGH
jgi:hypothetical protein